MQHSYSPANVSVCVPFWLRDDDSANDLFRTFRSFRELYNCEMSFCDDGSLVRVTARGARMVELPLKLTAMNPSVPINAAVANSTRPVIVLTNPGATIAAGTLERMLAELDERTYVAAACRDMDSGRWLCHSTVRGGEHGRGPMPPGSGFHFLAMLTRELWNRAGGFDEDYRDGQAYDDNDFLWRLHRAGAAFKVLDDVVIDHRRSTTQWPAGGIERNRELFRQKWGMAA